MRDIPYGYCHCGCGERTELAQRTQPSRGTVKGQPQRYVKAHHKRRRGHRIAENGCWIWTGNIRPDGYGRVTVNGRLVYAHRFYYEQAHGPIPDGLQLDHLCRNPSCVNPDHLEPVTNATNTRRGQRSRLTDEDVQKIRTSPRGDSVALAREFGIHPSTIRRIRNGVRWGGGESG